MNRAAPPSRLQLTAEANGTNGAVVGVWGADETDASPAPLLALSGVLDIDRPHLAKYLLERPSEGAFMLESLHQPLRRDRAVVN